MAGATFIHEIDPSKLSVIAEDINAVDDFDVVDLEELLTLDFEVALNGTDIGWHAEKPVVLVGDQTGGLVVVRVNPEAIRFVLAHPERFETQSPEDMAALEEFIGSRGDAAIYELATW